MSGSNLNLEMIRIIQKMTGCGREITEYDRNGPGEVYRKCLEVTWNWIEVSGMWLAKDWENDWKWPKKFGTVLEMVSRQKSAVDIFSGSDPKLYVS